MSVDTSGAEKVKSPSDGSKTVSIEIPDYQKGQKPPDKTTTSVPIEIPTKSKPETDKPEGTVTKVVYQYDDSELQAKMKEIELKMRHCDQVLLQIQSITTDQHIRIADLEKLPRIDPTSEINQLRSRQLFIEKRKQQHGQKLEGINENDAKYRQLKNKILSMDVFHSNLSLRMDNLDLLVHHALEKPVPAITQPETSPPPAKISKPEIPKVIQLEKIVWMGQRVTIQQAFDDIFNQMVIIRRIAAANMQGVLRNVLGPKIMEKLLDTGLEKVINMY